MKKIIALSVGILLLFTVSFAFADHHFRGNLPVSISTVLGQLEKQGYTGFRKVEYEHGTYKVEAYNAQGQRVKLYYNPTLTAASATTTKSKEDSRQLTMLEAVQKAEAAGYSNIYKIEFEHGRYEIKAINKSGEKVKLHVDPRSRKVSKTWFGD